MSEHTKEPWHIVEREALEDGSIFPMHILGGEHDLQVVLLESPMIAEMRAKNPEKYDFSISYAAANARRIVACVNHCVGIETEKLENSPFNYVQMLDHSKAMQAQRDKLLAAVKGCVENMEYSTAQGGAAWDAAAEIIAEIEADK
jgi:hypothetical protein